MRFVALDLETTGLSPTTDTIIEVAAVAFDIGKNSEGRYEATNIVEHSQLVYPGREMTEEISMITGITDAMLAGKPIWGDIQERVREFIGTDSIIVGHNVLFDIGMLGTHGIDISDHGIIDTFELSEIFSQDIESLNLGYLAGRYGLSAGDKEHRALGDTRLSVGLFVHYLNLFETLSERKKQILTLCGQYESKPNIGIFVGIIGYSSIIDTESLFKNTEQDTTPSQEQMIPSKYSRVTPEYHLTSLVPGREIERSYMRDVLHGKSGDMGVFGQEQVTHMRELLDELDIPSSVHEDASEYISELELRSMLEQGKWERKEGILVIKLLIWKEDTKTGLIRELKLYGKERNLIDYYRALSHENIGYIGGEKGTWKILNLKKALYHTHSAGNTLVIKDIGLLEEQIRRSKSKYIHIDELNGLLEEYNYTNTIRDMLNWIQGIYMSFPTRPTGDNPFPPGEYGETYFFTQSDIWHHGFETLALTISKLEIAHKAWIKSRTQESRRDIIRFQKIDTAIEFLVEFHTKKLSYNVILNIQEGTLTLTYIPREIEGFIDNFFAQYTDIHISGIQIHGPKIREFLQSESRIDTSNIIEYGKKTGKNIHIQPTVLQDLIKNNSVGGTVILTTSMKHVRELGRSLEHTGKKILMQGISGGKGKQLGLFASNTTDTILIGTIDMWRDTLSLWNHAHNVILAKLPFDPPTDPYFLARTVGMKNNFSLYSEPMIIIKLTTLIERIMSSQSSPKIYCIDNRLTETLWGKNLMNEIV